LKSCYVRVEGEGEVLKVCVTDDVRCGDYVLLELQRGETVGRVLTEPKETEEDLLAAKRRVGEEELMAYMELKRREDYALEFCKRRVRDLGLPMKLLKAEYLFGGTKLIFYFFSLGRVDFRALVRDLAKEFKTRIEMRQVGVRDEVKLLGGLGSCGEVVCCKRFFTDFKSVSVKMLKEQGLLLNPSKVSGLCGRLMCCLAFEYEMYRELKGEMPRVGRKIETVQGKGKVVKVDVIRRMVTVRFDDGREVSLPIEKIEEAPPS
jgi:cell fate regulator YaaT (PSP1 superfamily)